MPKNVFRRTAAALVASPLLCYAAAAHAQTPLITAEVSEEGYSYVQVNGTSGNDAIVMASTPDGGILVVRIANGVSAGLITAAQVQSVNIVVLAGDGDDVVSLSAVADGGSIEIHGGSGNDTIIGSNGSDLILGEDGDDWINGGSGTGFDTISGGAGFGDRLYAGPGGASISDEDGVAEVRGSDTDDSIAVLFSPDWVNPDGQRESSGAISGGGGNDFVFIFLGDEDAPILFSIDGDGQGTLNPGEDDEIYVSGNADVNSTFPNFEGVYR